MRHASHRSAFALRPLARPLVAIALAVSALAACGDGEPAGGASPSAPPASDSPTSSPPGSAPGTAPPDGGGLLVSPRPGMADANPVGWDTYAVSDDERTLTFTFYSGVEPCYVLDRVEVDETDELVTVTLFVGSDPAAGDVACIEIAQLMKVEVQLDAPLGDRDVADGAE